MAIPGSGDVVLLYGVDSNGTPVPLKLNADGTLSGGGGGSSLSNNTPMAIGTATPGVGTEASRDDHTHAGELVSATLGGDVTMTNANQFYDGPSISLSTGDWLVLCSVHVFQNNATPQGVTAKLWDGTTVYAMGNMSLLNAFAGQFSLCKKITLVGLTTVKVSVASSGTGSTIKAQTTNHASGNTASNIVAIKVG